MEMYKGYYLKCLYRDVYQKESNICGINVWIQFYFGRRTCANTNVYCGVRKCTKCIFGKSRATGGSDVGVLRNYLQNVNFGDKNFSIITDVAGPEY